MKDVTDKVEFNSCDLDGELLPIKKCICGNTFAYWEEVISIYPDYAWECKHCQTKLIFQHNIQIFDIDE